MRSHEDRITQLEKDLDKMKAFYEGLHMDVVMEIKGCEHEWTPIRSSDIRNDDFKIIRYDCKKCSQSKPVDKPIQTLAESLYNKFKVQYPELEYEFKSYGMHKHTKYASKSQMLKLFAEIADNHYSTLLQSEYQRGYEKGRYQVMENVKHNSYEPGVKEGRRQAIEEMKKKFDKIYQSYNWNNSYELNNMIKEHLFTESK